MLTSIKPKISPILNSIARPFSFIHPNILSLLGVLPYFAFFFLLKNYPIWSLVVSLGFCFDFLDGAVARLTNKQSAFGGILDSTLDRFTDGILIYSFAFAGIVSWELSSILFLFSFLVSYVRSRAELAANGKISLAVGIVERTERILLILLSLVMYLLFPNFVLYTLNIAGLFFIFLILLSMFTLWQRLHLAFKLTKYIK